MKKKILNIVFGKRTQKTATCPVCRTVFDIETKSDLERARDCLTACSSLKFDILPKFARFKDDPKATIVFRLEKIDPNRSWSDWAGNREESYLRYSVDNGGWGVRPYIKKGKIYSSHSMDHLNDRELVVTTKKNYLKATQGYAVIEKPHEELDLLVDNIAY